MSKIYFPVRAIIPVFTNIHSLVIVTMVLLLTYLYTYWPWRDLLTYIWHNSSVFWLGSLSILEFKYHLVGSLFFIPILYGAVVFRWRGALAAFLVSLVGVLPTLLSRWNNPDRVIPNVLLLFLPLLVLLAVVSVVYFEQKWRNKERQVFAQREKERQLFVSQIIQAQEQERQHIARELHDETIQTLSVVVSRFENMSSSSFDEQEVMRTKDYIVQAISDLRRLSRDLRPSTLDRLGLVSALSLMVSQMNKECEIKAKIIVVGEECTLSPEIEINIFRVVQEALNNVKHHAKASEATVVLEYGIRQLKVTVEDNGQGFDMRKVMGSITAENKLGLVGIRERSRLIKGTLQIRSKPGQGTLLSAIVTLPDSA